MKRFILFVLIIFYSSLVSGQDSEELFYDTGSWNGQASQVAYQSGKSSGLFVRFTPNNFPAKLETFKIYLREVDNNPDLQKFAIYIYDYKNNKVSFLDSLQVSASSTGWKTYNLTQLNIVVNNDFLAGIVYHYNAKRTSISAQPWVGVSCLGENCCSRFNRSVNLTSTPNSDLLTNPNLVFNEKSDQGCLGIRTIVNYSNTPIRDDKYKGDLPESYALHQNFPNPFNPQTQISYSLPKSDHVIMEIYNIKGEKVRTLVNQFMNAGHHFACWDGKDDSNISLSSGIYIIIIRTNNFYHSLKASMIK